MNVAKETSVSKIKAKSLEVRGIYTNFAVSGAYSELDCQTIDLQGLAFKSLENVKTDSLYVGSCRSLSSFKNVNVGDLHFYHCPELDYAKILSNFVVHGSLQIEMWKQSEDITLEMPKHCLVMGDLTTSHPLAQPVPDSFCYLGQHVQVEPKD